MPVVSEWRAYGRELGEEPLGTCNPAPDEAIEEQEVAEALDEVAQQCVECSWWVAPEDLAEDEDEATCNDCADGRVARDLDLRQY